MVLDDRPLQLVSEEYGDSMMESAGISARSAVKSGSRSRRKSQPVKIARQRTVRCPPDLSIVASDGSLHPSEKQASPVEPVKVVLPAGIPVRILLVDASKTERRVCCTALQQSALFEVEVLEAETGQDGLQMAFHQALDCIVLSHALPDMSSMEFVAQLAAGIGDARLPVLNLADAKGFVAQEPSMKDGAHECLIKDADGHYLALLPTIVKRMLDGHHNLRGKRQAEAMYRTLIEHIQAITYIVSPQHGNRITYVSPQVEQLGINSNLWTMNPGMHFQHVHEDDREAVERAFSHSCRSGEAFCQDYRLCCTNGSVRWFHDAASVVKDHNGQPMFLQGVIVDITNIKEMEAELEDHRHHMERRVAHRTEALERRIAVLESCNASLCDQLDNLRSANASQRQSLARGQALLEAFGGAVAVVDENASIIDMNEEAASLIGREACAVIGRHADEAIQLSGADVLSIQQMIAANTRRDGKGTFFGKALLKKNDGGMALVSIRLLPIHMQDKQRLYALMITLCGQPRWLESWYRGHRPGAVHAAETVDGSNASAGQDVPG